MERSTTQERRRAPDLQRRLEDRALCPGKRVEGAHLAVDLGRGPGPIDARLGLLHLGRVARARVVLGDRLEAVEIREGFDDGVRAHGCERPGELARGDFGADGVFTPQQHGTGIEPGLHLHDAHAGHGIAGQDGALDGRRAAPARQERRVDVEAAVARHVEHRLGQQQAVGSDHHDVGR